jgi:hypothetical protein
MRMLAVAAAILLCATNVQAQEQRRDGNYWNRLNEPSQIAYVTGVFDGLSMGNQYSMDLSSIPTPKATLQANEAIGKRFDKTVSRYYAKVSNDQLSDGLTEFFKDFRNRSILISDAIDIVVRQIAGENVESLIKFRRASK